MEIRGANVKDIGICMELEHSFQTDRVWQMQGETTDSELAAVFREIRLPRPMRVEYPRSRDFLLEDWQRNGCFLVAEEQGTILGYLDLQLERWNEVGRLLNLVVDEPYRRKGIGSALLEQGLKWGRGLGLRAILTDVQTKNHPAISLGRKRGFSFCGYNDQYYSNRDIALLLWLSFR